MRNLLLRDLGWKLFSLLLAAFIWVTVHKIIGPQIPESATPAIPATFGGVTVTVVGTSSPTTPMYHINSNSVSVTVAGPHEVMDVLRKNEIHAAVYLSDMEDPTRESTATGECLRAVGRDPGARFPRGGARDSTAPKINQ